jgi:CheY-like chemotaxis protein
VLILLVDEILTLSKLDSNLLDISPDSVEPPQLVHKALKMFQAELQNDEIETSFFIDESYEKMSLCKVMLDESRVIQILINLLANAIKFVREQNQRAIKVQLSASYAPPTLNTEDGSYLAPRQNCLDRRASLAISDAEEIFLTFSLRDTGRGLTEDEMRNLFKRFSQASPKTYGQYGGSGLGLFICRELVERHGGQIGLSSVLGEGTTVRFYIKVRRAVDSPETRLRTPSTTSSAALSTDQLEEIQRKNSLLSNSISSRKSSIDFNFHPSDIETPLKDIHTPNTNPNAELLHVLIVEDNLINQRVMSKQLQQLGCMTYTADHGLEALSFLEKTQFSITAESPIPLSCILCDLEMPVMDGLTCIKKIRDMQRDGTLKSHVPVIAVTANARSEQVDVAIGAGMVRLFRDVPVIKGLLLM